MRVLTPESFLKEPKSDLLINGFVWRHPMTKLNGNLRMGKLSEPRAICVHNARLQTVYSEILPR